MIEEKRYYARDVMTHKVVSLYRDSTLLEATEKIVENGFSGVPIVNDAGKIIGIITEYDLLRKGAMQLFLQEGKRDSILNQPIERFMNPEPLVAKETLSLDEIVKLFAEHHKVNPLPIVDENDLLTGIISRYDVIRFSVDKKLKNHGG